MSFQQQAPSWIVLIVDDVVDNLYVPSEILGFYGAKVHTARDGLQALTILETVEPTFILSDISMPRMDGWDFLKAVRANPKTASIPIIALTAHAMRDDSSRIRQAGFDGYIAKPFSMGSFWGEIERCLTALV